MASGVPSNGLAHCKRCGNKAFPGLSELRKHQWKAHRDFYAKMTEKRVANKQLVTVRDVIDAKAIIDAKPEMTARQLLAKLVSQRDFMRDVVSMVEGIISSGV